MEEIEEDKNMENNSNYISNDNNNNNISYGSNNKEKINININNNKQKINIPKLNIILNKNDKDDKDEKDDKNDKNEKQKNTLLYDKIISNNSNKNLIENNNDDKINKKNSEQTKIRESYYESKNVNDENASGSINDGNNNNNYLIDITNEELQLFKDEKYDINSNFMTFIKDFSNIFNNEEKDEENKILNIYLNKINEIEKKKGNIPNYYYFYLLHNKKIKMLKNMLDELFPYILNKCPEINKNNILIKLNNELMNALKASKEFIGTLHTHIESFNNKKNENTNNNNNSNLNDIIKEKDNKILSLESQKEQLFNSMNEDKKAYETKIEALEKENKIMTEKLLKNANNILSASINDQNSKINQTNKELKVNNYGPKQINYRNHSQTPIKRDKTNFENYNKNKRNHNNINFNMNMNKSKSPLKTYDNTISVDNNTISYINNINTSKHQLITLKTLKDFINELYLSKSNYDMKCIEFKLPKETLEEYMYTFLNKKYGLKNLIIDWARNIINGIKYYSKKDSFVLLFGKILRNEQEEDARFIIQKVLESIEELLLYYIKRQNPLKSIKEINKIFERKKKNELLEEEWKGIIYSIYEKREADEIEKKIENYINKENEKKKMEMFKNYKDSRINNKNYRRNKYNNFVNNNNNNNINNSFYLNTINSFNNGINNSSSPNNVSYMNTINNANNNKLTRIEKYNMLLFPDDKNILFTDFIKIVLDNHIRFRDKQLKNFVELFKSVDTNKDGVISEEEFNELIQKMKIFKEDEIENKIFQFLEKIDPFDNQRVTFSECVSFFSGEIIKDNDINGNEREISILEKVCFNGETNVNENGNQINREYNENEQNQNNNINNIGNNNENITNTEK